MITRTTLSVPALPNITVLAGDIISVGFPVKRKWWQLWKPRYSWDEPKPYQVVSIVGSEIEIVIE